MRTDDSNFRRSLKAVALKGAAGAALMLSCAAGIPALISVPGGAAPTPVTLARLFPVAIRGGGSGATAGAGQSAEMHRVDRNPDHASSPAPQAGASMGPEDAEIAVLLDWHLGANNVYGAIDLKDLPQSR